MSTGSTEAGKTVKVIPFMKYRGYAVLVSLIFFVFSLFVWIRAGEDKYGLDFLGGTELVLEFKEPTTLDEVRAAVEAAGYIDSVIQQFEDQPNEYSIKVKGEVGQQAQAEEEDGSSHKNLVSSSIRKAFAAKKFEVLKEDYVGPIIGEQIRTDGLIAVGLSLIVILIYTSARFEFAFAMGAVVALVHDVVISAGFYILSGREVNAAVLASLLTIIGYSLNDTIVIFDRVRENLGKAMKTAAGEKLVATKAGLSRILDESITQTLSRTLLTNFATSLVVIILWQFGGGAVSDLAFTFFIGLIAGTYSTVFIASPVVLAMSRTEKSK